jgi:hypothetical protein
MAHIQRLLEATQFYPGQHEEEYEYPALCHLVEIDKILAAKRHSTNPLEQRDNSIFMQTVKQLRKKSGPYQWSTLRQSTVGRLDEGQKRAFRVKLKGFGVDDHGGPYSGLNRLPSRLTCVALFIDICNELQSPLFDLFVPSPNQRSSVGRDQEKWVPNPLATSVLL